MLAQLVQQWYGVLLDGVEAVEVLLPDVLDERLELDDIVHAAELLAADLEQVVVPLDGVE